MTRGFFLLERNRLVGGIQRRKSDDAEEEVTVGVNG